MSVQYILFDENKPPAPPPPPPPPQPGALSCSANSRSSAVIADGKCLVVGSASRAALANVTGCAQSSAAQQQGWCVGFETTGVAGFKLRAAGADPEHPQCLQLQDNRRVLGSPFWLWNCSTGTDGSMDYNFAGKQITMLDNSSFCLGVVGGAVVLADCNDSATAVAWSGLPPPPPPPFAGMMREDVLVQSWRNISWARFFECWPSLDCADATTITTESCVAATRNLQAEALAGIPVCKPRRILRAR